MGLSASQARLLSLTARLSDLELRAQAISNSKIRLSDESEGASKKYSNALNKETLKVYSGIQTDGSSTYDDATARNLTTYNAVSPTDKQRYIKNSAGSVIVSQDMATAYNNSNGNSEIFLNNLGYSQYTSATRKAAVKTSSLDALSSDLSTALGSISLTTNTALLPATKNYLDSASSYLGSSKSALTTLGATYSSNFASESTSKSALSNTLSTIEGQLQTRYASETDATTKAAIYAELQKAIAADTALNSNNTATAISDLQSIDVNILSPKVASVYASNDSYIKTSSGNILIPVQLAKCIDQNGGGSDTALNGGIQPKALYLDHCVTSGFLTSSDAADPSTSNYKYYSKLYDLIDGADGTSDGLNGIYQIADLSGAVSSSNSVEVGRFSPSSSGANESSTSWLQSQIDAGLVTLYKMDTSTGVSTSQAWPTNTIPAQVSTAIGQAQALQAQQTSDAAAVSAQTTTASTAIANLYSQLNSLYNATSDTAQKALIYTQMGLAQTAQTGLTSANVSGALGTLYSMDIASLYNTLQSPVSTSYSSTLSSSAMAGKLTNLSDDFAAISNLFTSSALQSYDSGKQALLSSLIGQLSGNSAIPSALCQNIQSVLNGISVSDLATLIDNASLTKDYTYDKGLAEYDINIFNEIKESGGCTSETDKVMNSSSWLQSQIDAGNISLYEYNSTAGSAGTGDNVDVSWTSGDATLQETTDSTETAKAEAEYNTTMANIQSKDKRFDQQLSCIDTEHTATQTEVDSVKKVISKNVERSFKMFDA